MQFQRHVEAEVDDFGCFGRQLAEIPVVVGDQQLGAVGSGRFEAQFVQGRQGVQLAEGGGFGQRVQFGQRVEVRQFVEACDGFGVDGRFQLGKGFKLGQRLEFQQGVEGGRRCFLGALGGDRLGEFGGDQYVVTSGQGLQVQRLDQFRFLGGQHFDFLQRVGQGQRFFFRLDAVEDRGLFLQRVAQRLQAFLGHVENQVALGRVVFGETLEVVLDAGDGVGEGVQALPVGHGLARQELLLDITVAGFQQGRGTAQRDHRQATTDLGQQVGHASQVLVVPLRGDELDDRVLGLFQAIARFLDHQLVDLRHVGGGQVAFFGAAVIGRADHAIEGGFYIEQRAGDIHQHGVIGFALAEGQAVDHVDLVEDDPTRLAEAQHGEGVGDLLEGGQQGIQLGDATAIAAHEDVQAVLDPYQLLAEGGDHRAHGVAVGAGEAGTLLVHHVGVGQRFVEAVLLLQRADTRRLGRGLGDIEQQVLDQLLGSRLVDAVGALVEQALEFLVDLPQQGAHGGAVDHAAIGQAFDHAGGDGPERAEGRFLAQGFEAGEDARHVAEVGGQVLVADDPHQGQLQHLPQLAQQHRQFGGAHLCQGVHGQRGQAAGEVRGEQAGFRQQFLAPRRAQVVEQRQHHHGQVAARTLDAVEVDRQLQDGLHQHFQGFALVGHATFHQRLGKLFHFFGEQSRAVEFDHLQGAVDLVHVGQAETHARRVLGVLDERLQSLSRLLQGFRDLALDPLKGDIIVPITHSRLLSLPGECQNLIVGHRNQVRMVPTHYFAHAHHHQASRRQALGQAVEDFTATPAAKIDQQVLTEDYVHAGHWRLCQFQHIEPGAANARGQALNNFEAAIVHDLEITFALVSIQLFQAACPVHPFPRLVQGAEADVGTGHTEEFRPVAVLQRLGGGNRQRIRLLAAGTADAPERQRAVQARSDPLTQVGVEQVEGGAMAKEPGFLNGEAVQQRGPFHSTTRAVCDLAVVDAVVVNAQFAHPCSEIGLQEGATLFVDHHTRAFLEQRLPVVELRGRHVGQGFQGPHAAWLHAVVPLAHGRCAAASSRGISLGQACSGASGRLKPDTDLRISLAILARLPMLLAVAVVPAEVCEVISWITFMVLEMWPAEDAC